LTRSATIDEQRLALAVQEPKLADLPEADLKNLMRYLFMLVGIRGHNIPAGDEKEFLHLFIRKFYGIHTAAEVRLAFDLAVTGKLECDPKVYENFSTEYFARIMNAFRKWSAVEIRRLETRTPPTISDVDKKQIDLEYMYFLCGQAFDRLQILDKGPTALKTLNQWQKVRSRIK